MEGIKLAYERYSSEVSLIKEEKVRLMAKYISYYEDLINEKGIDVLNVKIPREVFSEILDHIGELLKKEANKLATTDGEVKKFLNENKLPPFMEEVLPDEFRAFSLLLNALKQWVSAESAATDRFLLGGTAKDTCRAAVNKCIVTGDELGDKPELHHPLRDGRPPILLSKKGHDLIEQKHQTQNSEQAFDEETNTDWEEIKKIRTKMRMSWVQLREGCNAIITGSTNYRPNAKTFANNCIRATHLSAQEIIGILNSKGLG
jgi:hypothetical protein